METFDDRDRDTDVVDGTESTREPETMSDRIVERTPWWGISIGLHVVAAIILAFVAVTALGNEEDVEIVMAIPDIIDPVLPDPPKPPVLTDRKIEAPIVQTVDPVEIKEDPSKEPEDQDDLATPSKEGDPDMKAESPFQSQWTDATIGVSGSPGGTFGHDRVGGRKKRGPNGPTGATESCVLAALQWLSRHQNPDGSWSVTGFTGRCGRVKSLPGSCTPNQFSGDEEFDVGVTGLSLLAFLGAGFYHGSKDVHDEICFGDVVRNGLQWLIARQDAEGCIGPRRGEYMYNHLIAALALTEAYGMTGNAMLQTPAQRAIDFTVNARNPGSGWRYAFQSGDSDSSVTGWAAMALKSAELSGLSFDRKAYDDTKSWYDSVTMTDGYGAVGYVARVRGKVSIRGVNDQYDHHEALTAIAVMSRIFIDKNRHDPNIRNGVRLLTSDLPSWDGNKIDFYYWYYASLALFQFDGPTGPEWSKWNKKMVDALVKHQNRRDAGDKYGSWEPCDRWSCKGGRVYATAINCLTLEVYYRYATVFGGR